MADGRTHARVAIAMWVPSITVGFFYMLAHDDPRQRQIGIGIMTGATAGLFITPDIDQEGTTFEEARMNAIPVWGFLWQWAWYGYARLFAHRGISHWAFVGTATRLLYLIGLGVLIELTWLGLAWVAMPDRLWQYGMVWRLAWIAPWCIANYIMWSIMDIGHLAMDTSVAKWGLQHPAAALIGLFGAVGLVIWGFMHFRTP